MSTNSDTQQYDDDDDGAYKPSPYAIALPKVQLSKSRPKETTSDISPTPFTCNYDENDDDVDDDESDFVEKCSDDDNNSKKVVLVEEEEAEGMLSTLSSRRIRRQRIEGNKSSATTNCKPYQSKLIEVVDSSNNDTQLQPVKKSQLTASSVCCCAVCNTNNARYTCPKCKVPYCSVSCYQIHDGTLSSNNNGGRVGKICTESFYKHHILSKLNTVVANEGESSSSKTMHDILSRMHTDINTNLDEVEHRDKSITQMLQVEESDNELLMNKFNEDVKQDIVSSNNNNKQSSILRILDNTQSNNITNLNTAEQQFISDDELAELASYISLMDDEKYNDDEHGRTLLESIPPHLLHAFECALAATELISDEQLDDDQRQQSSDDVKPGDLDNAWARRAPFVEKKSADSVDDNKQECQSNTKQFVLWWLPNVVHDVDENSTTALPSPSIHTTLDDRILSLPPLPKLSTANAAAASTTLLSFNILEVLYAASFVIRAKYNSSGMNNEKGDDPTTTVDATALLLSQSMVLANDARYTSVQETMLACSEQLVINKKTMPLSTLQLISPIEKKNHHQQNNEKVLIITWDVLAMDVAIISSNRRYVLRLLFEAFDICQSGIEYVNTQLKLIKTSHKRRDEVSAVTREVEVMKKEYNQSKRQYKLASKKIEYFCSWASSMWSVELEQGVSSKVRDYISDWVQDDDDDVKKDESSIERLIRGMHTFTNDEDGDGNELSSSRGGILDLGIGNSSAGRSSSSLMVDEQMVSVSTVRKK